ncbi:hypothetical protein QJS10_CPB22g00525 [Acorus calamus]|uniref:Uncharacterized protein n=1 Tax=Acorus calamus TaxID=4465 RepID=A0AAV9BXV2_ACOCL|nr:hypothetical protein QJS10_CPB22g00525 [Acorus calamus]
MATHLKLFSSFLLLLLLSQKGWSARTGRCGPADIVVKQTKTGKIVEGQAEYAVTVSNRCGWCAQSMVLVKCFGLNTVKVVDPRVLRPVDSENCVVNDGRPITRGSPVVFKYAWMTPSDFKVVKSMLRC